MLPANDAAMSNTPGEISRGAADGAEAIGGAGAGGAGTFGSADPLCGLASIGPKSLVQSGSGMGILRWSWIVLRLESLTIGCDATEEKPATPACHRLLRRSFPPR